MKLKPLSNRVVVEVEEADKASPGGILLPDATQQQPRTGRVYAAGPGRLKEDGTYMKMHVSRGDRILFGPFAGADVPELGDNIKIMAEDEILGILS